VIYGVVSGEKTEEKRLGYNVRVKDGKKEEWEERGGM